MKLTSRKIVSFVLATLAILVFGFTGPAHAAPTPASGPSTGGTVVTIPGIRFIEVAAGNNTMVALTDQGTVYSWGRNDYGQLGIGTTTTSLTPVQVKGVNGVGYLTGVTHIEAGQLHFLAVTETGLYAWGRNADGQLGDGTSTDRSTPVQVVGVGGSGFLPAPTAIAGGYFHTLAITADGVFAWGNNAYGQLGNNTTTLSRTPVQVKDVAATGNLTGVTDVAAGNYSSLALGANDVYSWGLNSVGQLGDGTLINKQVPVKVKDSAGTGFLSGATAIAAGETFAIALHPTGVFTWGNNTNRQLGSGTTVASRSLPGLVVGVGGTGTLTGVTSIGAGFFNGWAQSPSGVFGWGDNSFGKLGVGNTTTPVNSPVQTLGLGGAGFLNGVTSLDGGWSASTAILNGQIVSWGYNDTYGQLGDGTRVDRSSPVLSANFQPGLISVDSLAPITPTVSGNAWSFTTPAHSAGVVTLTATANIFGGTTAANPSSVSWNAGSFTYEAALAKTGSTGLLPLSLASAGAVLLGVALLLALRRQQK